MGLIELAHNGDVRGISVIREEKSQLRLHFTFTNVNAPLC